MQSLGTPTATDLRAKCQQTVQRFEVYDGAAWIDICAFPSQRSDVLAGWSYRLPVFVKPDYVDETLAQFPVLVKFSGRADIGATCDFQGDDIRFTAADGTTLLKFERESFAVASGAASGEFWVRVPSITTAGARIYIYWGNDAAANGEDADGVWDDDFKAVYHMANMNENTQVFDSTANANNGTKKSSNEPAQVAGQVGYGQDFDGTDDYITMTSAGSLAALTAEAWVKLDDLTNLNVILGADAAPWTSFRVQDDKLRLFLDAWDATGYADTPITGDGAWHHVAATWSAAAGTIALYIDGALVKTATGIDTTAQDLHWPGYIGAAPDLTCAGGLMDEARASSIARSAAWLKFEYRNMSESDYCLEWGAAQTLDENRLASVSAVPSGAGSTSEVIGGSWSATVSNYDDIFHPFYYASAYHSLFQIGRKARISLGGVYGGSAVLWQMVIGYMDQPEFDHKAKTVTLKGCDYAQRLTDFVLRESALTSGVIDGPLHWGAVQTFDSVSSTGVTGSEIYAESDAADTASEANSYGSWSGSLDVASVSDTGGGSTYALSFVRVAPSSTSDYGHNSNVGSATVNTEYHISLKSWSRIGTGWSLKVYQTIDASLHFLGSVGLDDDPDNYVSRYLRVTAAKTGALEMRVVQAKGAAGDECRVDEISIKTFEPFWYRYQLPTTSTGPYFVTLDGEVVTQGQRNDKGHFEGWLWDEEENLFSFDEDAVIENGTANLKVYHYTAQTVENVVADLLMHAGLYATRTEALAAMDYAATGVTVSRVRFEPKTSALAAIGKLCERVNYRFWFGYDGTPHFRPAQTSATVAFDFASYGDLETLSDRQDRSSLYNRVVIEGEDQASFQTTADKKENRWTGETSDASSIAAYGEHTLSIRNDLFQDQESIDAVKTALLAERKDPVWLATLSVFALPVPLEVGDTIRWRTVLGSTTVTLAGVIRNLTLDNDRATYTVAVVESQTSPGALPDIGAIEYQKGVVTPPATGLPDIGAIEYQGA